MSRSWAVRLLSAGLLAVAWRGAGPAPRETHSHFREGASEAGLASFHMRSGDARKRYIVEANSAGVCLFDANGDGWLDVFLVNGGDLGSFIQGTPSGLKHSLFFNQGNRTFKEAGPGSGVEGEGSWGMGCSVADYDNDGRLDLYVTGYGPNQLLRNRGDGTFIDVTTVAGAADPRWSTGSSWADFDRDGDLDLFVANYIDLDRRNLPEPGSPGYGAMGTTSLGCQYLGLKVMCGPRGLKGAGDSLFVNRGDGTFEEASARLGVDDAAGYYGLGALWTDLDGDGWPELLVANDATPNYLYQNHQGKWLEDIALPAGVAVNERGLEQAGMGVACGDYLNSGRLSCYFTHFSEDYNTLYRNDGNLNFTDATGQSGLSKPTLPYVGWGAVFLDFDRDGWLDLFVANGHVFPSVDQLHNPLVAGFRQPRKLYRNLSGGRFEPVDDKIAGLGPPAVGRGAAAADLDNDGALDIVVNNQDDSPALLWGDAPADSHYLGVSLRAAGANRFAVGARVRVRLGQTWQTREIQSGGSYASHGDFRAFFGLGGAALVDELTVDWPSGAKTALRDVVADQILDVIEPGSPEKAIP